MNTRIKAGVAILAAFGAVSLVHVMSSPAYAHGSTLAPVQGGGGNFQRRGMMNITAKVMIEDAIKTATGDTKGFVSSANLRKVGDKTVWMVHVVTEAGTDQDHPGAGKTIYVDGDSGQITTAPQRPGGGGGGGGGAAAGGGGGGN